MKTLIVVAHPNLKDSKVNKSWLKEAEKIQINLQFIIYMKLILMR